ncbi:MAG: Dabb family protein [Gammaproteobacteria bacterium]
MSKPFVRAIKYLFLAVLACALTACADTLTSIDEGTASGRLHHLVIIWLKQPGDVDLRRRYIEASNELAKLPGVISYDVGIPAAIQRRRINSALDESYDVAISAVYQNQDAFQAFLSDPEYVRIAQQVLRPMVDHYRIYDFVEP